MRALHRYEAGVVRHDDDQAEHEHEPAEHCCELGTGLVERAREQPLGAVHRDEPFYTPFLASVTVFTHH